MHRRRMSGRVTCRYRLFSRCHCSVEICSRTCRAVLPRRDDAREDRRLDSPCRTYSVCVSAYGSPVHFTSFGLAESLQHALPAPVRAAPRSHPASGSDSRRAGASYAPRARCSGSSSTRLSATRHSIWLSSGKSFRVTAQHPGILAAAALRRVDDQRAALQRHARQARPAPRSPCRRRGCTAADRRAAAPARRRSGTARARTRSSAARCSCADRPRILRANSSRCAAVDCGPISIP